jgi:diguanylate cyclase (GGDEF)-like protein/PAS domain S-box-containing protein
MTKLSARFPLRLHHRYFLAIMLLATAAMAAVSVALILQYERSMAEVRETSSRTFARALRSQFESRARGLALVTAEALVNPLALLNVEGTRDVIQAVSAEPDVVSVAVVDHAGLGLFSGPDSTVRPYILEHARAPDVGLAEPTLRGVDGKVEVSAPVRLGDRLLGVVTIGLKTEQIDRDTVALTAQLKQLNDVAGQARYTWLLGIAGTVLFGAGVSAVMMSRSLSRPIQALVAFTAQIGQTDGRLQVATDRADEIGGLARALEALRANLHKTMISRDAFDRILNSMQDGLLVTTPDGTITDVNHAGVALIGKPKSELVGRAVRELLPAQLPGLEQGGPVDAASQRESVETWLQAGSGAAIPVLLSAAAMNRGAGTPDGFVWVFHDITERKRAEEQIHYMAHHDALTALPNRVLLHDRLQAAMAQARRRNETLALLLLDLDDFKEVNDTLGHSAGDELLIAVAERITACVREVDTCARLGGDEFAIVQVGAHDADGADRLCKRLIEAIEQPFVVHDQEVVVGTSIGVSFFPRDGTKVEQLLKNADLALYQAKSSGRGNHRFFQEELNLQLQQQKALERELRQAVQQQQFVVHFQPQIEITAGRLVGVEALIRWHHPVLGLLAPDKFIPLAERTGLIVPIAEWVLGRACAAAEGWRVQTGHDVRIAVNLSPAQFHHRQNLAELVATALDRSELPPHLLELEITEGVLLQHTEANVDTLRQLKDLGVRIGMDDFGTGFASLACLRRFPFDLIKIDRSFIRDLERDPEAQAIVRAAVSLSRSLRMRCLAEGVETHEQLQFLNLEGCTEAQGYYFSRAVPAAEIGRLLLLQPPATQAQTPDWCRN